MLEIVCFSLEAYKTTKVVERMERRSLGCEMLNAKTRSLKLMYKVGNCNAGVNKGNVVLIKVRDVEMWQEASMVEWSTPLWTGKQNASEQKVGTGMGCPRLTWRHCLCMMNVCESWSSAGSCVWWRMWKATRKASIGMLAVKKKRPRKIWAHCLMCVTRWQRTWKVFFSAIKEKLICAWNCWLV